jgi:hypothetical protein
MLRPLIAPHDLQARTTAFQLSPDRWSQPFLVLRLGRGTGAAPQREQRPGTQSVEMVGEARSGRL